MEKAWVLGGKLLETHLVVFPAAEGSNSFILWPCMDCIKHIVL